MVKLPAKSTLSASHRDHTCPNIDSRTRASAASSRRPDDCGHVRSDEIDHDRHDLVHPTVHRPIERCWRETTGADRGPGSCSVGPPSSFDVFPRLAMPATRVYFNGSRPGIPAPIEHSRLRRSRRSSAVEQLQKKKPPVGVYGNAATASASLARSRPIERGDHQRETLAPLAARPLPRPAAVSRAWPQVGLRVRDPLPLPYRG